MTASTLVSFYFRIKFKVNYPGINVLCPHPEVVSERTHWSDYVEPQRAMHSSYCSKPLAIDEDTYARLVKNYGYSQVLAPEVVPGDTRMKL